MEFEVHTLISIWFHIATPPETFIKSAEKGARLVPAGGDGATRKRDASNLNAQLQACLFSVDLHRTFRSRWFPLQEWRASRHDYFKLLPHGDRHNFREKISSLKNTVLLRFKSSSAVRRAWETIAPWKLNPWRLLKSWKLYGSFSAVSKPIFASKYSLESSWRDLQD